MEMRQNNIFIKLMLSMKSQAYDGNINTYSTENNGQGTMLIDASMRGKKFG